MVKQSHKVIEKVPELPEVETIRTQLSKKLPIRVEEITYSEGYRKNIVHTPTPELTGQTLISIERHGKWMIFLFSRDIYLLCHLGMTGAWLMGDSFAETPHIHLSFSGTTIGGEHTVFHYCDPRRFGHMYWYSLKKDLDEKLASLGVDLLSEAFTWAYFEDALKRMPNRAIKVALLEQRYFPGIGNYLANEVCAHAGVRPTKKCQRLTKKEKTELFKAIPKALNPMLKNQGLTFQGGYKDTTGSNGEGLKNLIVFHQKVCRKCLKTPVKRIVLAKRGTFYCPSCQK